MRDEEIQDIIKEHEGFRLKVYRCSEGVLTGGWGHTGQDLTHEGQEFPKSYWEARFQEDYAEAVRNFNSLPYASKLPPVQRAVVIMMLFNLGLSRFMGFVNMNDALKDGDYIMASYHGLDSKWRRQVKGRANQMMAAMMTGVWV